MVDIIIKECLDGNNLSINLGEVQLFVQGIMITNESIAFYQNTMKFNNYVNFKLHNNKLFNDKLNLHKLKKITFI